MQRFRNRYFIVRILVGEDAAIAVKHRLSAMRRQMEEDDNDEKEGGQGGEGDDGVMLLSAPSRLKRARLRVKTEVQVPPCAAPRWFDEIDAQALLAALRQKIVMKAGSMKKHEREEQLKGLQIKFFCREARIVVVRANRSGHAKVKAALESITTLGVNRHAELAVVRTCGSISKCRKCVVRELQDFYAAWAASFNEGTAIRADLLRWMDMHAGVAKEMTH